MSSSNNSPHLPPPSPLAQHYLGELQSLDEDAHYEISAGELMELLSEERHWYAHMIDRLHREYDARDLRRFEVFGAALWLPFLIGLGLGYEVLGDGNIWAAAGSAWDLLAQSLNENTYN